MYESVTKKWLELKRNSYLLIASGVIVIALFALLLMQYQSISKNREQAKSAMKANLNLRLFELSEDAKRGIMDHANHIAHGVRQKRIRERNIQSIEYAYTRLVRRYKEIEDCYVVFFSRGQENETWQALKFVRPDANDPIVKKYDGIPIGSLKADAEASESTRRAWNSVRKGGQTKLYSAYDPLTKDENPKQYFFHTVFETDRLKRTRKLENIGLLVFSARPDSFPSKDFLPNLVAKHRERNKSIDGLVGELDYLVSLDREGGITELVSSKKDFVPKIHYRFEDSDKLFPNLSFSIVAPKSTGTLTNDLFQSSLIIGLVATALALFALALTLRSARSEMKIAQMKSDFLANISHELKTPLTSIRAFGDLIHSGRSKNIDRIREYGGVIKTESDRLTKIINDILEISRLEKGTRKFRLKSDYLRDVLEETIDIFRHSKKAEGFSFDLKLPSDRVTALIDSGAIKQVLFNLISNAVKYSDEVKKVEISLEIVDDQANIKIRDFGVGISPEDQQEIFKPFRRSGKSTVQGVGGTGLGLAIASEIIKGHGGKITVESELGEGATFVASLPLLAETPEESASTVLEASSGTHIGYRR